MAQNVISEFVVSLGIKPDAQSLTKFNGFLRGTGESIKGWTARVGDGLRKVEGGFTRLGIVSAGALFTLSKFSEKLESLYFSAQRTNTSVAGLQALELTFQNMGVAAGQASSSVARLAERLKFEPTGTQSLLNLLGVQARDATGKIRDAAQIYFDILDKIAAKRDPYQQDAWLSIFELTRGEFSQYQANPNARRQYEEQKQRLENQQRLFGINAQEGNKFASAVRTLQTTLENLFYGILSKLTGGEGLQKLNNWLEKNGKTIIDQVVVALKVLASFITEVVLPILQGIIKVVKYFDEQTDGWSTKIIAFLYIARALGAGAVISGIYSLASAFVALGAAFAATPVGRALAVAGAVGAGIGYVRNKVGDQRQEYRDSIIDKFVQRGWTREQAIAIVANLEAESSLNPTAISPDSGAAGLAQWRGPRRREFQKRYGKDPSQASVDEQIDFIQYELTEGERKHVGRQLKQTNSLEDATRLVSDKFETPSLTKEGLKKEADKRVGIAQNINNTYKVEVHTNNPEGLMTLFKQLAEDAARSQAAAR